MSEKNKWALPSGGKEQIGPKGRSGDKFWGKIGNFGTILTAQKLRSRILLVH